MKEYFGNPSSLHKIGMNCEKRLNEAREYFASTIKCNKEEIYFIKNIFTKKKYVMEKKK